MMPYESNGPRYMDEIMINTPMNHDESRTNNGSKINALMQSWTQGSRTKEFESTMCLSPLDLERPDRMPMYVCLNQISNQMKI